MNIFEHVRKEKHWSYYRLGKEIGITPLKAERLCKGKGWPRDKQILIALQRVSGHTIAQFWEMLVK
jgi:hypothetical protein